MSHVTTSETNDRGSVSAPAARPDATHGKSIMRGIKGTLRFFAPSIIVGLAAPFVFPAIRRAVRPAAKGLVKGTLSLSESIKEGAAEAREQLSDLLAEVKAEREAESQESPSPRK
jgi:uncharacterized protein DUF5132